MHTSRAAASRTTRGAAPRAAPPRRAPAATRRVCARAQQQRGVRGLEDFVIGAGGPLHPIPRAPPPRGRPLPGLRTARTPPRPRPPHSLRAAWPRSAAPPGGPKLRKWYGQEDGPSERGGGDGPQQQEGREDDSGPVARDMVLVTDGESAMGEQVALQLILAR
jgi:hypothetical protein